MIILGLFVYKNILQSFQFYLKDIVPKTESSVYALRGFMPLSF